MVRTRVTGLLLASALTGAVVTSCSDETDPRGAPTSTTTSTTPTTPPPTSDSTPDPKEPGEPTLPAAAKAPTRAGAEAFVRYYIKVVNYAGVTGDVHALKNSASTCRSCKSLAGAFRKTYAAGGHYRTDGWRIESQFTAPDPTGDWVSLLEVRQSKTTWVKAANAEPKRFPAKKLKLRFEVKRVGGVWRIAEFTQS